MPSEREELVTSNWTVATGTKTRVLTQNGEKGLGGLDRHGEERAGVLALI